MLYLANKKNNSGGGFWEHPHVRVHSGRPSDIAVGHTQEPRVGEVAGRTLGIIDLLVDRCVDILQHPVPSVIWKLMNTQTILSRNNKLYNFYEWLIFNIHVCLPNGISQQYQIHIQYYIYLYTYTYTVNMFFTDR